MYNEIKHVEKVTTSMNSTGKMPVLFLGHGSPMNAIEENEFVQGFRNIAKEIPRPQAIVCISAHWETRGTFVTAMKNPPTIHDFGGFPEVLYNVQYPAPGAPELAHKIATLLGETNIGLDYSRGLDHGAWSVIKHLFPKADVPLIEMSLDYTKNPQAHYEMAQALRPLRDLGILIIGSGNLVHNLRKIDWKKLNEIYTYDWAIEANEKMKAYILEENHSQLINFQKQGEAFNLAIPTPEHYLPLLYSLSLRDKNEELKFFNDKIIAGSLSMTSFKIG